MAKLLEKLLGMRVNSFRWSAIAGVCFAVQPIAAPPVWSQVSSPVISEVQVPGEGNFIVGQQASNPGNVASAGASRLHSIANEIESARKGLNQDLLPTPANTRRTLEASIDSMQARLGRSGAERQADWMRFLKVEALQAELIKENPDLDLLQQIEKNTRQNYPGLDFAEISAFRNALVEHIDALRFGANREASVKALDLRLESLQKVLIEKGSSMTELEIDRDLGLIVSYLNSSKQLPGLRQQILSQYSSPAARVLVSSSFLQRAFGRPVNQTNPVNETILGTKLRGTSFISGNVVPLLVANNTAATIQLNLIASFSSNNVGVNRGVQLRTSSSAGVAACETIQLTNSGLVSFNDTGVDTSFQSQINSIEHRLRLVRKIASRKAAEQKPMADAIGQQRLETRIGTQFHEQLTQQLAESNLKIAPPALPVISRLGLVRPTRSSWTSNQFLALLWHTRDSDQLAATGSCPLVVQTEGITAQIHQSVIINYLDKALAGRVIRSQDLDDYAIQFGAQVGADLEEESKGEPWSVTLASYHPVEVEFDGNQVAFQIRTVRLDRGDQALTQPATIRANYRIEVIDGYIQLYRVGDVDIQFAGRAQRGTRGAVLRGFLKSKFDKAFKQTLFNVPVRPTDRLPAGAPALKVVTMETGDGWLQAFLN